MDNVNSTDRRTKDRRIFQRLPVDIKAEYLNMDSGKRGQAKTHDIAANGIGLIVEEELPVSTALNIWLEIPENRNLLCVKGEVIWLKKIEPHKYRAGVKLDGPHLIVLSRLLSASNPQIAAIS